MINSSLVLGIDPSMRGMAACCCLRGQDEPVQTRVFESAAVKGLSARIGRYQRLVSEIRELIDAAGPAMVLLEGYSYASPNGAHQLGELGGLLRLNLVRWQQSQHGRQLIEVSPSTLKQFAAGKGNCKKIEVVTALTKRYGVEFRSDDLYDAYGLARLGACVLGWDAATNDGQRKAVQAAIAGAS